LISEARKACPDVIIVLGEDLTRFRNYSKDLYAFLRQFSWNGRAERLGFDEVWLDVTDIVDYNVPLINSSRLEHSFFCLDKDDPTNGFAFNASNIYGKSYPSARTRDGRGNGSVGMGDTHLGERERWLLLRLLLASHLAAHLRTKLAHERGFTATVGISTNKLLSKLVGNVNKPEAQTTLLPPYQPYQANLTAEGPAQSNVTSFLDLHEIGSIPGIGHKGAQQIRQIVLGHCVDYEDGLVAVRSKEKVTVREVLRFHGIGPELLESCLGGPGAWPERSQGRSALRILICTCMI